MNDKDKKYGVPEQKKFPMPDAAHVRSAIRFFNYVEPRYEKKLAKAILARMREYGLTFDDFTVGEENRFSKYIPKDELKHHGILGMHWGVRRFQNKDGSLTAAGAKRYQRNIKTASGEDLVLTQDKKTMLAKALGRLSKNVKKAQDNTLNMEITDSKGKRVGNLELYNEGNGTLNGVWLTIDPKRRGHGYASSVMKDVISYAREKGYKQVTLEVPGISPDARHIYEKLGFKAGERISEEDDIWGGLTKMSLQLDELEHHGILGMHWGIRRYQNKDGSWTSAGLKRRREQDGSEGKSFLQKHGKTIAKVALATATIAGAAYLYSRNKKAVGSVIKEAASETIKSATESKSTVNTGKAFVEKTVGSAKPKISLTFDARIDPDMDLASQVKNLRSEINKQAAAIKNSPDMQKYVEELLQRG